MIPVKVLAVRYLPNASPALCRELGVPENIELICYLPVGKPAEEGGHASKLPFGERAWFNGYRK